MHTLEELEKQQIGLKLPKYLINEIDNLTKNFAVNRTDIIIEAIRSYIQEQKINLEFEKELSNRVNDIKQNRVKTLTREEVFYDL